MVRTAILVDGGFYRRRAAKLWGKKTAAERAEELRDYCKRHLKTKKEYDTMALYRIFYYDCPPLSKMVFHPLTQKNVNFAKSETYEWSMNFLNELKHFRKFALRLGRLADVGTQFILDPVVVKKLCTGKAKLEDLKESDFSIDFKQKGVDMRIGIDIASLAYKHQVDRIVLIAGDSDFVPAAKLARREGIDFILDPMGIDIASDLFEHIDGLRSFVHKNNNKQAKEKKEGEDREKEKKLPKMCDKDGILSDKKE